MNATLKPCDEDDLGYEFHTRQQAPTMSNRIGRAAAQKASGRQRFADHARYQRKRAPVRMSGMHQRGRKRHAVP